MQPQHVAADSPVAQQADGAQHRSGQGPTPDAHEHRLPVLTDDLGADPRWPRLAEVAAGAPVRAAVAVPLMLDALPNATLNGEVAGVLTLYSARRAAFSDAADLDRALTVSTVAGAALAAHRRKEALHSTAEHLRIAMSSRAPIEQAKGLVAGWLGCGVEDAFAVMTGLSQDRNVKVRDLAVLLVADPASPHLRGVLTAGYARLQQRRAAAAAAAGQDGHADGRPGDRRSGGRPSHR
nr:GAF and ANTAR domain-containing protein [Kineococcus vitellinus]